jgi:ribosomal protein S27AE
MDMQVNAVPYPRVDILCPRCSLPFMASRGKTKAGALRFICLRCYRIVVYGSSGWRRRAVRV